MAYTKTTWASGDTVTDVKLNNAESGIADADTRIKALEDAPAPAAVTWANIGGKPAVVAAGADAAAARTAIGATDLKLGTTATTALKGDTVIPAATAAGTRAQLDAGTDTTVRAFSAKDISEFVAAKIAAANP